MKDGKVVDLFLNAIFYQSGKQLAVHCVMSIYSTGTTKSLFLVEKEILQIN